MNMPVYAQDSAEIAITDWSAQIVEEDEFGEPITEYSDEWVAPDTSAWTAVSGPADIFDSRPLTEWEIY